MTERIYIVLSELPKVFYFNNKKYLRSTCLNDNILYVKYSCFYPHHRQFDFLVDLNNHIESSNKIKLILKLNKNVIYERC